MRYDGSLQSRLEGGAAAIRLRRRRSRRSARLLRQAAPGAAQGQGQLPHPEVGMAQEGGVVRARVPPVARGVAAADGLEEHHAPRRAPVERR